jgi:hypothetical protein
VIEFAARHVAVNSCSILNINMKNVTSVSFATRMQFRERTIFSPSAGLYSAEEPEEVGDY